MLDDSLFGSTRIYHSDRDFTQRYLYQLRGGFGPKPKMPEIKSFLGNKASGKSSKQKQMDKARKSAARRNSK